MLHVSALAFVCSSAPFPLFVGSMCIHAPLTTGLLISLDQLECRNLTKRRGYLIKSSMLKPLLAVFLLSLCAPDYSALVVVVLSVLPCGSSLGLRRGKNVCTSDTLNHLDTLLEGGYHLTLIFNLFFWFY